MGFPLPLPDFCRGCGKWAAEAPAGFRPIWLRLGAARELRVVGRQVRSVTGEAIAVAGFDDAPGGGHGGEARVEGGGSDAAAGAQFSERAGPVGAGEGCDDALVDGRRRGLGFRLAMRLDGLEREGIGALGESQGDAGDGGGGGTCQRL